MRIKLQEQPFRVLVELVANAGKVVSRQELKQKLWPADTFVDFDVGLNSSIRKLRQALNDDADSPHYIEMLAKRGYRFIAPVANIAAAPLPMLTGSAPVIKDTAPPILVSAARAPVSSASDGKATTLLDAVFSSQPDTDHEKRFKKRPWYWVVVTSCALVLMVYGVILAWRGSHATPLFASEQRITANPPEAPVTGAVVSPDGKYVAYSDTTGVYIRHIDSGETQPLGLPKGFDAVPTSWFPDSGHLLLSVVEGGETTPSLWKVSILGGSPQKVVEDASEGVVSPDGSKIAFQRDAVDVRAFLSHLTGYAREIWVVDTNGSNLRRLSGTDLPPDYGNAPSQTADLRYSEVYFYRLAWSPDGGRVAYFRVYLGSGPEHYALETIGINGGPGKVLESSVQIGSALCWAADGRLLYADRNDPSSESFDYGIQSVQVNEKNGEPEHEPMQLTKGVGRIGGLSVTASGKRLILWRVTTFAEVFLTEIDAETSRLKVARRLTLDEHKNLVDAWTPDSSAILFTSNRNGTFQLFRQAIDQTTPEMVAAGRNISLPRLNPDGTQILYLTGPDPKDPAQMTSVMQVPLRGGPPRLLLQKPFIQNIQCARTPSKLCFLNTAVSSATRFFSFDPESGESQEFANFQVRQWPNWSLSPDGSQLALIFYGPQPKVTFMKMADKSTHDVTLNEWPRMNGVDWAADSKSVFVSSQTPNGVPVILSVAPSGHHPVLLEGDKWMRYLAVVPSPDGRYGALQALTGENNVWMLENF